MRALRATPAALLLFSASAFATNRPVSFSVRVVDADGSGVAGARVVVSDSPYLGATRKIVVLARLDCDADGRAPFSCDESLLRPFEHYLSFWAMADGHGVGQTPLSSFVPPDGSDVVVELPACVERRLTIVDDRGAPVAGARVLPRIAGRMNAQLPDELSEALAVATAADGTATFRALDPAEFQLVRVEGEPFGAQELLIHEELRGATQLALAATGVIEGRIVLGAGVSPAHRELKLTATAVRKGEANCGATTTVTTDDEGRFRWERVPADRLTGAELVDESLPFCFTNTTATPIAPGAAPTAIVLEATRARIVEGRVAVGDAATPLPDATLSIQGVPPRMLKSGADGSFRFRVSTLAPVKVAVHFAPPPAEPVAFGGRGGPMQPVEFPDGDATVVLPPLVIERGATLHGTVRDAAGATVTGAWLRAGPDEEGGQHGPGFAVSTQSAADGSYELAGLPRGRLLQITVRHGAESLREPKKLTLSEDLALDFAFEAAAARGPRLVVVDPDGQPVAGASVAVWSRYFEPKYSVFLDRRGDRAGHGDEVRAGADGVAPVACPIEPEHRYRFAVDAAGFAPALGEWFDGGAPPAELRLVLPRLATVRGRVVDARGEPVAGARVLQSGDGPKRTQVVTDERGRFELGGYAPGPAFVFVDAPGFRFAGAAVAAPRDDVELVVARQSEPPRRLLHALPPALARADELAFVDRIVGAELPAARANPDAGPNERLLEASVATAPRRSLAAIDAGLFGDPWFRDYARRPLAKAAFAADLDEGVAITQSMETAQFRTTSFLDAVAALPDLDRERRRALLLEALANARQVDAPALRVVELGNVAGAFARHDDPELARRIFAEASPNAEKLGGDDWEAYARGAFAEQLAPLDLKRARELADSITDAREADRHHGNLAHVVAALDPAAAEELFGQVRERFTGDQIARRVCYRMAPVDLARARRIAAKVQRREALAQTHLVMARALIENGHGDAVEARRELDLGLEELASISNAGEILTNYDRCAAGLGLAFLPVVELVAPDRVEETFWRALSWRRAPGRCGSDVMSPIAWRLQRDGSVALAAARYDRAAASHLIARSEPLLEEVLGSDDEEAEALLLAEISIDAAQAEKWLEIAGRRSPREALNTRRAYARVDALRFLIAAPEERWDNALARCLGIWIVDHEDD